MAGSSSTMSMCSPAIYLMPLPDILVVRGVPQAQARLRARLCLREPARSCVISRLRLKLRRHLSRLHRDGGAGDGDFDDEAGALGLVVLDPDRAAVLAHDLVDDRQAEAHAGHLRREVGQEEL